MVRYLVRKKILSGSIRDGQYEVLGLWAGGTVTKMTMTVEKVDDFLNLSFEESKSKGVTRAKGSEGYQRHFHGPFKEIPKGLRDAAMEHYEKSRITMNALDRLAGVTPTTFNNLLHRSSGKMVEQKLIRLADYLGYDLDKKEDKG